MKVLIVEDQQRLGRFLQQGMSEHSYTVTLVGSCREARDALCETGYDVIVLDLGLPDGDGLDLLREWRRGGFNEPVLILSARDTVEDRIKGLDIGADDYLPKPFSLEELLARVRSLLRRHASTKETVLEHRGIRLDLPQKDAMVYEDGYLAGRVGDFDGSRERLALPAGSHRIEIRADAFAPLTFDVNIEPGRTIVYSADLRQPQQPPAPAPR